MAILSALLYSIEQSILYISNLKPHILKYTLHAKNDNSVFTTHLNREIIFHNQANFLKFNTL